jgi:hypothetical protein
MRWTSMPRIRRRMNTSPPNSNIIMTPITRRTSRSHCMSKVGLTISSCARPLQDNVRLTAVSSLQIPSLLPKPSPTPSVPGSSFSGGGIRPTTRSSCT